MSTRVSNRITGAFGMVGVALIAIFGIAAAVKADQKKSLDWAMNATIIEACSCPMFCQCYFNPTPAGESGAHGSHATDHAAHGEAGEETATHYCKFNNAYRVNGGHYGDTSLDGARFWVAGDLGAEFDDGRMDWAVLTFDPSVTEAQRQGIMAVLGKLYPVEWDSFEVAEDARIEWTAGNDKAVARLDSGRAGEVMLNRFAGMTDEPVVIRNLRYWGAPRNDGFVLMPNTVEAYRLGDRAFEYKGTNGFMITFDINSND